MPRAMPILALPVLALAATAASAQEHGAHEHGVGQLNVAVDGSVLEIELIAPGADIVGFEHAPGNDVEQAALASALTLLGDGDSLFRPSPGADCTLAEAEVENPFAGGHDGEHAEFHAHYHFDCADPAALTGLTTRYFEVFPTAHELEVQALTPNGQTAAELAPGAVRLDLAGK